MGFLRFISFTLQGRWFILEGFSAAYKDFLAALNIFRPAMKVLFSEKTWSKMFVFPTELTPLCVCLFTSFFQWLFKVANITVGS